MKRISENTKVTLTISQLKKLVSEESSLARVIRCKDMLRRMIRGIYDVGGSVEELRTPYVYRIYIGDGPGSFNDQKGLEDLCKCCLADVDFRGEGNGYFDMKITDPAAEVIDEVISENQ